MSDDFVLRVLKAFEFDNTDSLWWNFVDDKPRLYAQCSDFFEWGTADLEEILPEDIELLEQCVVEVTAFDRTNMYAGELFAARKRKQRAAGCLLQEPARGAVAAVRCRRAAARGQLVQPAQAPGGRGRR